MAKVPADVNSASQWRCLECSYTSRNNHNVFDHIEAKHIKHAGYFCHLCHKTCPTKSAFRMHNKRNHDQPQMQMTY